MTEQSPASAAGSALARAKWAKKTAKERSDAMIDLAGQITPEKASARAKKAWRTKKRNAKLKKKQESEKILGPEK